MHFLEHHSRPLWLTFSAVSHCHILKSSWIAIVFQWYNCYSSECCSQLRRSSCWGGNTVVRWCTGSWTINFDCLINSGVPTDGFIEHTCCFSKMLIINIQFHRSFNCHLWGSHTKNLHYTCRSLECPGEEDWYSGFGVYRERCSREKTNEMELSLHKEIPQKSQVLTNCLQYNWDA